MGRFRGMSDGERAIWNETQVGEAPVIRVLWQRKPHARKPYVCEQCREPIAPGERYESVGLIEDGAFRHMTLHINAAQYPSGCPSTGQRDAAELADQFEKDRAAFFPSPNPEPAR